MSSSSDGSKVSCGSRKVALALSLALVTPALVPAAIAESGRPPAAAADRRPPAATGTDRLAQAPAAPATGADKGAAAAPPAARDPREGEAQYEQSRKLMQAIDAILQDAARNRSDVRKLPSRDDYLLTPIWTETREDREKKVQDILEAALGVVTDVPVVDIQKKIEERRRNIRELEERIVKLREKQLTAPKDGMLPGILNDTVDSLAKDIDDTNKRVAGNRDEIAKSKSEVVDALAANGIKLSQGQIDLLLDGVLSGDLVRLVAVFNSAKAIDAQIGKLMAQSGDNTGAARKYFGMHAALFAMLVQAQTSLLSKIDTQYLPKLEAIGKDIAGARAKTAELMRAENRPDQQRALEANRDSQKLSEDAARAYRRYLLQQREQIAAARRRAEHDLRIADNTFETVEASFQLRNLMRDSAASFEAIQKLEAPTFEQIFKNEELRREFENLTRKLDAPGS